MALAATQANDAKAFAECAKHCDVARGPSCDEKWKRSLSGVAHGSGDIVEGLLAQDANPKSRVDERQTALMTAGQPREHAEAAERDARFER